MNPTERQDSGVVEMKKLGAKKPLGTPAWETPCLGPQALHECKDGQVSTLGSNFTLRDTPPIASVSLQGAEVLWKLELSAPEMERCYVA